jgi:hypothetical protein
MTFDEFVAEVHGKINGTAAEKGYNRTGADGPNQLYRFVSDTVGGDAHAIGECLYKLTRYAAKGNPEDLIKTAAWCFLILKHVDERKAQGDGAS